MEPFPEEHFNCKARVSPKERREHSLAQRPVLLAFVPAKAEEGQHFSEKKSRKNVRFLHVMPLEKEINALISTGAIVPYYAYLSSVMRSI